MFEKGTYIVYVNGDRYEIGRVVSTRPDGAFVCYHEGETAAKTPYECMHRLENQYVMTSLGGDRFADVEKFWDKHDTISRQDVIDALMNDSDWANAILTIESLPLAMSKIGTCKHCIYWNKLDYDAPRQGWCHQFEEWTGANEFCSRCER